MNRTLLAMLLFVVIYAIGFHLFDGAAQIVFPIVLGIVIAVLFRATRRSHS